MNTKPREYILKWQLFNMVLFKISQKFKTKREYLKQERRNCVYDVSELRPPVQFFAQNTRPVLIMHS